MSGEVAKRSFDGGIDGNGWKFENSEPISHVIDVAAPLGQQGELFKCGGDLEERNDVGIVPNGRAGNGESP